jgi:DNA/RNA endonuclease G (NUC1)
MKKLILLISLFSGCFPAMAQTVDTTGGYISVFNDTLHNPICNYELLTKSRLKAVKTLKLERKTISFFPDKINKLYDGTSYSRGHVIPFEDLAYSETTAKASMNLNRNLAPQPQDENIGTKLACENRTRVLADSLGSVEVYGGTFGHYTSINGINAPVYYWTVIVADKVYCYLMPTHTDVLYSDLYKCKYEYKDLVKLIGFDPIDRISKIKN